MPITQIDHNTRSLPLTIEQTNSTTPLQNAIERTLTDSERRALARKQNAEKRAEARLIAAASRDPSNELSPAVKKISTYFTAAAIIYAGNQAARVVGKMVESIPSAFNGVSASNFGCTIESLHKPIQAVDDPISSLTTQAQLISEGTEKCITVLDQLVHAESEFVKLIFNNYNTSNKRASLDTKLSEAKAIVSTLTTSVRAAHYVTIAIKMALPIQSKIESIKETVKSIQDSLNSLIDLLDRCQHALHELKSRISLIEERLQTFDKKQIYPLTHI